MIYKRQKSSPCKLVVILSMAIFFGLLLISPSDRNEEAIPENITEGTGRQGSMISKNGVSQDRVITWMRNRTLSPWESSILTQQERIYFHETTGHESLNLRQLCAVESAAKNNPDRSVQIFLQSDRVSLSGPLELVLKTYTNVVIVLINASDYFAETVKYLLSFPTSCNKHLTFDLFASFMYSHLSPGTYEANGESAHTKQNIFLTTSAFCRCTKEAECIWI